MMADSKLAWRAFWPLAFVLVAVGLFIHPVGQRTGGSPAPASAIDVKRAMIQKRIKAKYAITQRVIAGEMGLLEAAAWFGSLNETPADCPDENWRNFPGQSDGEKLCRQVLAWVTSYAEKQLPGDEQVVLLQALEEELQQHIARYGRVKLVAE
jgi:hypothetical protein